MAVAVGEVEVEVEAVGEAQVVAGEEEAAARAACSATQRCWIHWRYSMKQRSTRRMRLSSVALSDLSAVRTSYAARVR